MLCDGLKKNFFDIQIDKIFMLMVNVVKNKQTNDIKSIWYLKFFLFIFFHL